MFVYFVCAKEFGWIPEQVDKIDNSLLQGMMIALNRVREREQENMK